MGGRCTVGHFCPNGSSVESDCTPGYYCDVDELAEPTGECWAGHFCSGGSTVPNPTDGVEGSSVIFLIRSFYHLSHLFDQVTTAQLDTIAATEVRLERLVQQAPT